MLTFLAAFVFNNKLVVALSVLLLSFFISTITLAVQKNQTRADLRDCRKENAECHDLCDSGSTSQATTIPTEATTVPSEVTTVPVSC